MKTIKNLSCLAIALSVSCASFAQTKYATDSVSSAETPVGIQITSINGAVSTFSTLADFQSAAPLATNSEDFEDNAAGGAFAECGPEANSLTNDTCFTPGQIVDGINITPDPAGNLVLLPPGFNGLTDSVIGAITFSSTTNLAFTNGDTAAFAFDVYAGLGAASVDISIFDTSNALIDTVTVAGIGALPDNQFIGVVAPSNIGRINIASQMDNGELIDNLLFGPVGPPPSAEVSVNPANGSNLNFGNGGTSGSSSVTIINAASAAVDLTNVNCSFSGGDAANFNVDTLLPGGPIAPGGSLTIALSATVDAGQNLSSTLTCTYDGDANNSSSSWTASISGRPRVIPSLGTYGLFALGSLLLLVAFGARRKMG